MMAVLFIWTLPTIPVLPIFVSLPAVSVSLAEDLLLPVVLLTMAVLCVVLLTVAVLCVVLLTVAVLCVVLPGGSTCLEVLSVVLLTVLPAALLSVAICDVDVATVFVVDNAVVVASSATVIVDGILTLSPCLPPVVLVSHCPLLKG